MVPLLTAVQTAKIAANCARSLLLQPRPTPADQTIARHLLPRLVAFVTNTEPEDPERARALVAATLSALVTTTPPPRLPATMALVVPALLARAAGEEHAAQSVYRETSTRLLELAAVDAGAFRAVVGGMADAQKAFMEEVVRAGRGGEAAAASDGGESGDRPTIALKMDFGG
jgi:HEAT repeat-containing protein 5